MDGVKFLEDMRRLYAERWSGGNAAQFEESGDYAWMAEQLPEGRLVFELGTGDGRGTLALLQRGCTVVSLDENPECLTIAHQRIAEAGFDVQKELRGGPIPSEPGYRITYSRPRSKPLLHGAVLLEGDLINEPRIAETLLRFGPYDAVVCWLIGTHDARSLNEIFDTVIVRDVKEYRLCIQNKMYELAETVLKPHGLLNIVDRGQSLRSANQLEEFLAVHRAQASVTTLTYLAHAERPYTEQASSDRVPMTVTGQTFADSQDMIETSLVSITYQKPE